MLTGHVTPIAAARTRPAAVEPMLRRLAAAHREVLVATYFSGRTTREAALVLGLEPATVSLRLHQAMRQLTRLLVEARG